MSSKERTSAVLPENHQVLHNQNIAERNKRFCRFAYRIGSFFCVVPWYNFKNYTLKRPLLYKVYAAVYGLCLGVLLMIASLEEQYMVRMGKFDKILETCSQVISIFLTEFVIFSSMFMKSSDCELFVKELCTHLSQFNLEYEGITLFYVQFFIGHILFAGTMSYTFYIWSEFVGMSYFSLPFLSTAISSYYCFMSTLIACNLALVLKCKYKFINKLLIERTQKDFYVSEKQIVADILEVGKFFRTNGQLVDWFNNVFGWIIVFVFWHALVEMLRCPSLVLIVTQDAEIFWKLSASIILGALVSLAECIYLIWCCEAATCAGKKMVQICNKIQENFEPESIVRNELFKLAYIAKTYEPKFTAADLFVINKGTVLSLINITTTYLIVIVQLSGILKEIM